MNGVLTDICYFNNISLPDLSLEAQREFMDLGIPKVGIYHCDRAGTERRRLSGNIRRDSGQKARDDRSNVAIKASAAPKLTLLKPRALPGVLWKMLEPNRNVANLSDARR